MSTNVCKSLCMCVSVGCLLFLNQPLTSSPVRFLTSPLSLRSPADGSLDRLQSNYVFLGLNNISDYGNRTQFRRIAAVERHFNFSQDSNGYTQNDIAIVRLSTPAVFGATVQPLCLPRFRVPAEKLECQISGYGKSGECQQRKYVFFQTAQTPLLVHLNCF